MKYNDDHRGHTVVEWVAVKCIYFITNMQEDREPFQYKEAVSPIEDFLL